MLTPPEDIRTLQRKLYRKAKQEPAYRFYALYDKICRADILSHAYNLVRANKGNAGIDGVTFEAIETKAGVSAFEADFCGTSYGFRPKRSAHGAVDDVAHTLNKGYSEVIDADLSKYFDTIPHAGLLAMVAERISDGEILRLIKMWLKAPVMVNATVRGWAGYFHYRNCSQTLALVSHHLEERLITHLRKRHKVRNRKAGYVRFPQRALYERYGLYKVPTSAAWTKAHA